MKTTVSLTDMNGPAHFSVPWAYNNQGSSKLK